MNYTRLDDIISFTLGNNSTRIKDTHQIIYTKDDFEMDLHGKNTVNPGCGCIVNLMRSKAAPLSEENKGKSITANYLLCEFDDMLLDPWYFCYLFNESPDVQKQITKFSQGTVLSVKRLNVQMIANMEVKLPDISRQSMLGNLYRQTVIQYDLMLEQAENMKTMTMALMRKIEED